MSRFDEARNPTVLSRYGETVQLCLTVLSEQPFGCVSKFAIGRKQGSAALLSKAFL